MNSFGELKLSWVESENYDAIQYIDNSVLVFKCDSFIKFFDTFSKQTFCYSSPGEGVGVLVADTKFNLVAFSEVFPQPRIFVHTFAKFEQKAVLKDELGDGAELEYTALAFSHEGNYLASYSGVGDFKIIIWNWQTKEILCKNSVGNENGPISSLSFNPTNWRQLVSGNQECITFWSIERSNKNHFINPNQFSLVLDDSLLSDEEYKSADSHPNFSELKFIASRDLIESALNCTEWHEKKNSVVPLCHTWLPSGHVLFGCKRGEIIKIDTETHTTEIFHQIPLGDDSVLDCAINVILMHKNGVYVATDLGQIFCLDLTSSHTSTRGQGQKKDQQEEEGSLKTVLTSEAKLLSHLYTNESIASGYFSMYYDKIVFRTKNGSVLIYQPSTNSVEVYEDYSCGKFSFAQPIFPGNDMLATVREDGTMQVWTMDVHKLVGSIALGQDKVTCLESSPSCGVVMVGTESGYCLCVSVVSPDNMHVIHRIHVSENPVSSIKFSVDGSFFMVGCGTDDSLWLFNGCASKKFETIGYLFVQGTVHEMDTFKLSDDTTRVIVTSNPYPDDPKTVEGHYRYTQIDVTSSILKKSSDCFESAKGDLKESAVNRISMNLGTVNFGCQVTPDKHLLFGTHRKPIHAIKLIEEYPKKPSERLAPMKPAYTLPGHGVVKCLAINGNKKWLASGSSDGTIRVGSLDSLDANSVARVCFHLESGGVKQMFFSTDAKFLICLGQDGVVAAYKIMPSGKHKSVQNECASLQKDFISRVLQFSKGENEALETMKSESVPMQVIEDMDSSNAMGDDNDDYRVPLPNLSSDPTCKELALVAGIKEEDKSYEPMKREILSEIKYLRKQHEAMIESNEAAPDIEKLERNEFVLDTDDYNRMKAEGDQQVAKAYESLELENLAKMFVRSVMKQECWDKMTIKGKSLRGFGKGMIVSNFPLCERSEKEKEELAFVTRVRKVEMVDAAAAKQDKRDDDEEDETAEEQQEEEGEAVGVYYSTDGSLSSKYGGHNPLLYPQLHIHSKEQKINQIVLLKDSIHSLKNTFNKDFDEVFRGKEQEMNRINDRNARIGKILSDLNMDEQIKNVDWTLEEKPEENLVVKDSEVKVERYLSPEMKARLEEEQKLEEERRLAALQDNWRERGLDQMMGGVLEIRKEDELKKDVPIPAFLAAGKAEAEYTAEEKAAKAEYDRKVAELIEEREKFYKQLEAELRKLQQSNSESENSFDEQLTQLFNKKVQVEIAVFHQELKIVRMQQSLLVEEQLEREEAAILKDLEAVKEEKLRAVANQRVATNELNDYREKYENIIAEDRVLDRNFRKEFSECSGAMIDALQKQYKRRPRGPKALKKDVDIGMGDGAGVGNPYNERPSSAMAQQNAREGLFRALEELEAESYAPEGIDLAVWKKLCDYRRKKLQSEQEIKMRAQRMAEIDAFLKRRGEDERAVSEKVERLQTNLQRVREEKHQRMMNLELQLLMRQGQVEVAAKDDFITEFKDSLLVHRGVVEQLNSKITALGDQKIESMNESKEFRKGIYQLEWERKKMIMEIEDLLQKAKDIQRLKVTKELQFYLNDDDDDDKKSDKKAREIGVLEKTISSTLDQHSRRVEIKKDEVKRLKKKVKDKEKQNDKLDEQIMEMTVTVAERELIQMSTGAGSQGPSEQSRMKDIVQRRKLVDLAKNQAQEVAVLRAEVERLRMRTFPALVQIE
ncbi:cilia- and flagella-associated protein 43-like isoform X2 [Symsagittifera roscoffensis]|uniref:cilia- and flagella-associated protein 43-like isoform X2 n=1 Tax=Symsagittifera roscoffensis TaxID=84072 RepID=UPI00307B50C2